MSNDLSDWLSGFHELNPDTVEIDEVEEKKKYKLDLFKTVLPALDRHDKLFYGKLTEDEKKSISPWLLMRWLTSADSDRDQPHYLLTINDLVNHNFSLLSPKKTLGIEGHEELQWMLLTLCTTGRFTKRRFIKGLRGSRKNKLEEEILKFYPNLRDDELELFFKMNDDATLVQFFKDSGYDDKVIKELFKSKTED